MGPDTRQALLLAWRPPTPEPEQVQGTTTEERFADFNRLNPHVLEEMAALALQMRRTGRQHYGINGLMEVMRWRWSLQTHGDDFKLNNNYAPLYARLLMEREPELAGFFKLRRRRGGE